MYLMDYHFSPEEFFAFSLRDIYSRQGYSLFRMSRFEEYDFYAGAKDFLTSKHVLTFSNPDGRLMALRPDVTLSIIRNIKDIHQLHKFYYDEKVYRVPHGADAFREIPQTGIECIGPLGLDDIKEVIALALETLCVIAGGRRYVLDAAHAGLVASLVNGDKGGEILKCLCAKNVHGLRTLNADERLIRLAEIPNNLEALSEFDEDTEELMKFFSEEFGQNFRVDFSTVNNLNYYNGLVFRGFVEGLPEAVLSGGQYDGLLEARGLAGCHGVGFAVNLSLVRRLEHD